MAKEVDLFVIYGSKQSIDSIAELAVKTAKGGFVSVTREYSNGSLTGGVSIEFDDLVCANEFREAAATTHKNVISSMDGRPLHRKQRPSSKSVSGELAQSQDLQLRESGNRGESIHQKNLSYWDRGQIQKSQPRMARRTSMALNESPDRSTLDQSRYSSRPVSTAEYGSLPFSAVGKLAFRGVDFRDCQGDVPYFGSAWLIAPRVVMTVAHNLFEVGCRDESSNIVFYPGYNSSNTSPNAYSVVRHKYVFEYAGDPPVVTPNPAAFNDVGIGILDREADSSIGFIPALTNHLLSDEVIHAIGYPGNHDGGENMWACAGAYSSDLSSGNQIAMASDFGSGSSGCPWLIETDSGWRAIGSQVGPAPGQAGDYSISAPFTSQVDELLAWAESVLSAI